MMEHKLNFILSNYFRLKNKRKKFLTKKRKKKKKYVMCRVLLEQDVSIVKFFPLKLTYQFHSHFDIYHLLFDQNHQGILFFFKKKEKRKRKSKSFLFSFEKERIE